MSVGQKVRVSCCPLTRKGKPACVWAPPLSSWSAAVWTTAFTSGTWKPRSCTAHSRSAVTEEEVWKKGPACQVNFWTFLNLSCISQDHKEEVTCVSFNTNDSAIASGSTSGDLVLHSLTTNVSSKAFGHGSNQVRLSSLATFTWTQTNLYKDPIRLKVLLVNTSTVWKEISSF